MHIGFLHDERTICLESINNGAVRLENLNSGDTRKRGRPRRARLPEQGEELGAFIYRKHHGNIVGFTNFLVVFTIGGCLMNDTGTISGTHVIGNENLPGGSCAPFLGIGEIVPQRGVAHTFELGAGVARCDGSCRILGGALPRIPKVFRIGSQQISGDQEAPSAELTGTGNYDVFNVGSDGERLVGG